MVIMNGEWENKPKKTVEGTHDLSIGLLVEQGCFNIHVVTSKIISTASENASRNAIGAFLQA